MPCPPIGKRSKTYVPAPPMGCAGLSIEEILIRARDCATRKAIRTLPPSSHGYRYSRITLASPPCSPPALSKATEPVSVLGIDTLKFVMAERGEWTTPSPAISFPPLFNLDAAKPRKKGELPPMPH
jgi:hypothetical protein